MKRNIKGLFFIIIIIISATIIISLLFRNKNLSEGVTSITTVEPLRDHLFDIHFIDNNNGWAVGYFGKIIHTKDGGETWEIQASGTENVLTGVSFNNLNNGWAVGHGGTILHTKDGGKSWIKDNSGVKNYLFDVSSTDPMNAWVCGEKGVILHTSDGGEHWEVQLNVGDIILNGIDFINPKTGWVVGEFGIVLKTEDGGITWKKLRGGRREGVELEEDLSKILPTLYSVKFLNDKEGFAVGVEGEMIYTPDGGLTWSHVDTKTKYSLYRIMFNSNGIGCAVGLRGTTLISLDGGKSWVFAKGIPTNIWLYGISIFKDNIWVAGAKESIFEDSGKDYNFRRIR
jgi:photosystem II stability/assembly factor-like uncharacterized protein